MEPLAKILGCLLVMMIISLAVFGAIIEEITEGDSNE